MEIIKKKKTNSTNSEYTENRRFDNDGVKEKRIRHTIKKSEQKLPYVVFIVCSSNFFFCAVYQFCGADVERVIAYEIDDGRRYH